MLQVEGVNFQGVFCDGSVEFLNYSCFRSGRSSIGGKGIFRLLTNFTCTNCVRQNNQIKMRCWFSLKYCVKSLIFNFWRYSRAFFFGFQVFFMHFYRAWLNLAIFAWSNRWQSHNSILILFDQDFCIAFWSHLSRGTTIAPLSCQTNIILFHLKVIFFFFLEKLVKNVFYLNLKKD